MSICPSLVRKNLAKDDLHSPFTRIQNHPKSSGRTNFHQHTSFQFPLESTNSSNDDVKDSAIVPRDIP